ncbi:MAG: hypothetical protein AAGH40_02860 [Verrucomicrobiota bacterium]
MRKLADKRQSESLRLQARKAVELYLGLENAEVQKESKELSVHSALKGGATSKARVKGRARVEASGSEVGAVDAGWNRVLKKMKLEIRRREYSPKTLSTYTGWSEDLLRLTPISLRGK